MQRVDISYDISRIKGATPPGKVTFVYLHDHAQHWFEVWDVPANKDGPTPTKLPPTLPLITYFRQDGLKDVVNPEVEANDWFFLAADRDATQNNARVEDTVGSITFKGTAFYYAGLSSAKLAANNGWTFNQITLAIGLRSYPLDRIISKNHDVNPASVRHVVDYLATHWDTHKYLIGVSRSITASWDDAAGGKTEVVPSSTIAFSWPA